MTTTQWILLVCFAFAFGLAIGALIECCNSLELFRAIRRANGSYNRSRDAYIRLLETNSAECRRIALEQCERADTAVAELESWRDAAQGGAT